MTDLLPRLVWHMDEPTADPAIITAYLVCREARKQATVLLSGVGGDELFAGYRKHVAHYWAQAYGRVPSARAPLAEAGLAALPSLRGTALKGQSAPGEENGAQRFAQSDRPFHHELHLSRCGPEISALQSEISRPRLPRLIRPAGTAPPSSASATPIFCTRCFISTPRFS